jgi:hypothetical protein
VPKSLLLLLVIIMEFIKRELEVIKDY